MTTRLTREDVVQCYETILKRSPENEEVIDGHLANAPSLWELISRFVGSEELRQRVIDSSAMRSDVIQVYKRILKRDPESEAAIKHHLSNRPTIWDLVTRLVESEELKKRIVNTSGMSLYKCIDRNYLIKSLPDKHKYSCFLQNHAVLCDRLSSDSFRRMFLQPVILYQARPKECPYDAVMRFNWEMDNEGEILLQFRAREIIIYSFCVSIVPGYAAGLNEPHVILISRMQGAAGKFQEIRLATKEMDEIHPQAILVAVLRGIAQALGIKNIAGTSAGNQLSYKEREKEFFERVYDQFFRSIGATGPNHGLYHFSVASPEKAVPAGHRGRKKLKREIKKQIANSVLLHWGRELGPKSGEETALTLVERA